ncbi:MAG: hypothetical protein IPP91_02915 [Betaproteobacteria bacterium]|nr:hypothetical protein [Betaproteobacteria bacterium]
MNEFPLGFLELHAGLLDVPGPDQVLVKVMKAENFARSVCERYLHFNRVDGYRDFPDADHEDGAQLPGDRVGNVASRFEKSQDFTASHYYDLSRARTYAYCVSLNDSPRLWEYGAGAPRGQIGIYFRFGKLRSYLNELYGDKAAKPEVDGHAMQQILSLNYGLVRYIDRNSHRENANLLPNPIIYTFLKDLKFADEAELRITLSAIGIGSFQVNGNSVGFPNCLRFPFDYVEALKRGAIERFEKSADCDPDWLRDALEPTGIVVER